MYGKYHRRSFVKAFILLLITLFCLHSPQSTSAAPYIGIFGSPSAPGETIFVLQPTLSWPAWPGALHYHVYIQKQVNPGNTTWISPEIKGQTSYTLPAGVLTSWGEKYSWYVSAITNAKPSNESGVGTNPRFFQTASIKSLPCDGTTPYCYGFSYSVLNDTMNTLPPIKLQGGDTLDNLKFKVSMQDQFIRMEMLSQEMWRAVNGQ